jgi:uncharacterized protein YcbX
MNSSIKVSELWRYPVKSMLGEACDEVELESRGVVGDRLFAVQDSDGYFGSGKDTRRFRKIDGLLSIQAKLCGEVPQVELPDGRKLFADDPIINSVLSGYLGQPVQLVREAEISHLDDGPVHVVTCSSLSEFSGIAPVGAAGARRFRPNIVLESENPFEEHTLLGKHVRIGQAELRFTSPTERCAMVTFPQAELVKAPHILRYIAQELGLCFGVYAEVVKPGAIKLGDLISEVEEES